MQLENTEAGDPCPPTRSKTTHVFCAFKNQKRQIAENENIANISTVIYKLDEVLKTNISNVDHEFGIFAKHVVAQLKQMLLSNAIICQEEIQSVIRRNRMQLLMNHSEYCTHSSSEFPRSENQTTTLPTFSPSYISSPSHGAFQPHGSRPLVVFGFKSF